MPSKKVTSRGLYASQAIATVTIDKAAAAIQVAILVAPLIKSPTKPLTQGILSSTTSRGPGIDFNSMNISRKPENLTKQVMIVLSRCANRNNSSDDLYPLRRSSIDAPRFIMYGERELPVWAATKLRVPSGMYLNRILTSPT